VRPTSISGLQFQQSIAPLTKSLTSSDLKYRIRFQQNIKITNYPRMLAA
jgi:hypothetical protein